TDHVGAHLIARRVAGAGEAEQRVRVVGRAGGLAGAEDVGAVAVVVRARIAAELLPALTAQATPPLADLFVGERLLTLQVLAEDHLGHRPRAGQGVGHRAVVDALARIGRAQLGLRAAALGRRRGGAGFARVAEVVAILARGFGAHRISGFW